MLVSGGESAVNLLGLDNLSQTVALGQIESGSQVLSATFLESNMEIGINGTNYPVTLATGGNALPVDITDPPQINGTENVLLLDMSPTVINSSSGYQLVPSSLGVFKPQSEITPKDAVLGIHSGIG